MDIELSEEAREFGVQAQRALSSAADPEQVLADLGVWDLDLSDPEQLEAAAAVCRAAGWAAIEVPVAEGLADPSGSDPIGIVLPCWTLLGMLDRAMAETVEYVKDRHQFGQPLAAFQNVQFQLTDAEVERAGLEMLARYALWSRQLDDALAVRVAAIEAAEVVFRICHQLHGAIGFCDETFLSWVSRRSLRIRREPWGLSPTRARLLQEIDGRGLTGLFGP